SLVPQIVAACDSTKPEVTEKIVAALAALVGPADAELVAALDVPEPIAIRSVVAACGLLGKPGIAFLVRATANERSRNRMNAVAGLGKLGKADSDVTLACLEKIEAGDVVPDVRTAAKQAML